MDKIAVTLLVLACSLSACDRSQDSQGGATPRGGKEVQPFTISAIPDQDPEKLQRLYQKVASYVQRELKVPVVYKAVVDYTASVTAFKVGDIDMVWYGGLTGVQARLQVEGAMAIAQRDVDEKFHTVVIANKASGITPFTDMQGLTQLKGHTFTFGSESSTSGRLMPQYFLKQVGVALTDFKGNVGFSGSHDKTSALVTAGTYDAGVLNEQVWKSRLKDGTVDLTKIDAIWTTPEYHDYHWVIHPGVKQRYGEDFIAKVKETFFKLDPNVPEQKAILDLFGAGKFIPTQDSNYKEIEAIGRELGKIK
jgi:phosphonate transport system substrate-binding protein